MPITLDPTEYEAAEAEGLDKLLETIAQRGIITGPVGRLDEDSHRWYVDPLNSDLVYESVTTIIGDTTDKPALVRWASNLAAETAVEEINEIIRLMQSEPTFDADGKFVGMSQGSDEGRAEAIKYLKSRSEVKRELASCIGTYQHNVLEGLILDSPGLDIPEELRNTVFDGESLDLDEISDGLLNFFVDHSPHHLMAEATVVNTLLEYAGTMDYVAIFERLAKTLKDTLGVDVERPVGLGDLKTGKHLYLKPIEEQLNALYRCNEVWLDRRGNRIEMPEVHFLFVIHLRKEFERGYKLRIVPISEVAFQRFLHRREVIRGGVNDVKFTGTVIYPPLPDGTQPPPMIEDVPAFSRCAKALRRSGFTWMADFEYQTEVDLLRLSGVGPGALKAIKEQIIAKGLPEIIRSTDEELLAIKGITKKILAEIRGSGHQETSAIDQEKAVA